MLRRILAGILVLVFVTIAVPLGILWATYQTFFDRDFYKGKFVDATYDLVLSEVPRELKTEQFSMLEEEEIRDTLSDVVLKEDLQDFLDDAIDGIESAEVVDNKVHVNMPLDWVAAKSKPLASALADLMYEQLPICEDGDLRRGSMDCVSEDLPKIDFTAEVERMLDQEVFSQLPSEFAFDIDVNVEFEGNIADYLEKLVNTAFLFGALILLVILLIISLIIWSPFVKILKWVASAVVFSSMFLCFYFGVFLLLPSFFYGDIVEEIGDEYRYQAFADFYDAVFGAFAKSVLIYVGPVFLVSLGVFIYVLVAYDKNDEGKINSPNS